jgi:hypothetical protein
MGFHPGPRVPAVLYHPCNCVPLEGTSARIGYVSTAAAQIYALAC